MTITHINPPELHTSPVFSQGVLAEGGRTLYIGGQNGTDATGAIVPGGVAAQAAQAMRNVLAVRRRRQRRNRYISLLPKVSCKLQLRPYFRLE